MAWLASTDAEIAALIDTRLDGVGVDHVRIDAAGRREVAA